MTAVQDQNTGVSQAWASARHAAARPGEAPNLAGTRPRQAEPSKWPQRCGGSEHASIAPLRSAIAMPGLASSTRLRPADGSEAGVRDHP
jgi:hypothetical protein